MKYLLKNIAVFVFLSVAVSNFAACSDSASSQKSAAENSNSPTAAAASKSSEYPPAPVAVMQSEIKDVDGKTFKLEDKKGKTVLVNLWATWCGPCRAEMPELVALQDKHREHGFEIVGLDVDTDETPEQIKDFARTMKLNYTLGYADEKIVNDLFKITKTSGIPQSFLIDGEGKLRGVFFGSNSKVINELKENVGKVVAE